jgi:hypothetical protein
MDLRESIATESFRALVAEQNLQNCINAEAAHRIAADKMLAEALDIGRKYQEKTKEEKVIELVKGGLENRFGISFDEFMEIYNNLLENYPEKLV